MLGFIKRMLYPLQDLVARDRVTLTDRQKRNLLEGYVKIHVLAGDGHDLD